MYAISKVKVFVAEGGHSMKVLAGGGVSGNNATGEAAGFGDIKDLCVTDANIFVADQNMVRRVSFVGVVTTFAGSKDAGHVDAQGESARFNLIMALDFDESSKVFVCADANNHRIREITVHGIVTTIAGTGVEELKDGLRTAASFKNPQGLVTCNRWIFVSDTGNQALRCISPDGIVRTIAGGPTTGHRDACGGEALLHNPASICHDGNGRFYFIDTGNQRVRTFAADVSASIPLPPSDMTKVLASLCDEEAGNKNDLIFIVQGRPVYGLRAIVRARSKYFAALIGDSRDVQGLKSEEERAQARQKRFADASAIPLQIEIQDASYEGAKSSHQLSLTFKHCRIAS